MNATADDETPRWDLVRTTLEQAAAKAVRDGDLDKAETLEHVLSALDRIEAKQ